jgi:hypothetical protein
VRAIAPVAEKSSPSVPELSSVAVSVPNGAVDHCLAFKDFKFDGWDAGSAPAGRAAAQVLQRTGGDPPPSSIRK